MRSFRGARLIVGCLVFGGTLLLGSVLHLPARAFENSHTSAVQPNSCNAPTPCFSQANGGNGPAIEGHSFKGYGIYGLTDLASTRTASAAGLLGYDAARSETGANPNAGVLGKSTLGYGVEGKSQNSVGVYALGPIGVEAISATGLGVYGITTAPSGSGMVGIGVYGADNSSDGGTHDIGVQGLSLSGTGVLGSSQLWVGVDAIGGAGAGSNVAVPALSIVNGASDGSLQDLIDGCASRTDTPCEQMSPSRVLNMDALGNLTIAGHLYTSGSCSVGCATSHSGPTRRVLSYAPAQAEPSIEDFGEAQLVNGRAIVRLRADFVNVIDQRRSYLVFITPEGPCKVLFVTNKTSAGFVVQESERGLSTIPFSYRIVATPFGERGGRLPMETLGSEPRS
jgi:hypothetical protein